MKRITGSLEIDQGLSQDQMVEVIKDHIKYLYDILADNSPVGIKRETDYSIGFIIRTINEYKTKKHD